MSLGKVDSGSNFDPAAVPRRVSRRAGLGVSTHPNTLPHSPQQFSKGQSTGNIGSQNQGIHEESDQSLELGSIAIGDGRADHDIVLPGVAMEQRLKRRQESHE